LYITSYVNLIKLKYLLISQETRFIFSLRLGSNTDVENFGQERRTNAACIMKWPLVKSTIKRKGLTFHEQIMEAEN